MSTDPRDAGSSHRFRELGESGTHSAAPSANPPTSPTQETSAIKSRYYALTEEARRADVAREFAKSSPTAVDVNFSTGTRDPMIVAGPSEPEYRQPTTRSMRHGGSLHPSPGNAQWDRTYPVHTNPATQSGAGTDAQTKDAGARAAQIAEFARRKNASANGGQTVRMSDGQDRAAVPDGKEQSVARQQRAIRVQTHELSERAQRIASSARQKPGARKGLANGHNNDGSGR